MSEKKKVHPLLLAWAIGVFDARVTVPTNGYTLRFDSTDEQLVRRFADTIGYGKVMKRDPSSKKRQISVTHVWLVENMDQARETALKVLPLLSTRKTNLCADLIARIERNPLWKKRNKGKALTSVTGNAKSADTETPPPNTQTDG